MKRIYIVSLLSTLVLLLAACTKSETRSGSVSTEQSIEQTAEQLYTKQPPLMPELALDGQFKVGVTTLTVNNPQQLSASDFSSLEDRSLILEVWYPAQVDENSKATTYSDVTRTGKAFELQAGAFRDAEVIGDDSQFPLIVLSHGYTGYRTIMFYLGEHLASHGYVVVGIDHTDSGNADIDFVANPFAGFPSTLINRARDQQFVLDYFTQLDSSLAGVINTDSAAVIGHSMGGYGAINTVGACYSFSKETMQQFGFPEAMASSLLPIFNTCNAGREKVDERWKGMMVFAPWGGEQNVHDIKSLNKLKVPAFYISGDQDDISGFENGVKKLFENTGTESEGQSNYMLVYENARHNIATHPAPKVAYDTELDIGHYSEPGWSIETINRINEHMSLAFLNCHVKEQASACEYLPTREDITQVKLADGSLSEPWPGFQPRWGAGVKFYRKYK